MSELPQTQEISELSAVDGPSQVVKPIWGGLFPLKPNMPALSLSKAKYTIGRDLNCDIVLNETMFTHGTHLHAVSKEHLRISRECVGTSIQTFIYDLSTNGTFVNGTKIGKGNKQPLSNNDEISIATKHCKCFLYTDTNKPEFPAHVSSKYTICRSLGRGACGEVRVAYNRSTCAQYAMKIVQKKQFSTLSRDTFGNRELTEVKILKRLNYPFVVKVHDVIDTPETLFIVLDLVEGGELFDRITQAGHLSEEDTKFIFLQMLMATKYLHDNNVTHRDLKPENILLSGNSNKCLIKVTDFGLSKIVHQNTMLRTFCGTPTYLAPEVLLNAGASAYTPAIDVWSLGVILYVCLVGYPPFTDERVDCDLKTQIVEGRYEFHQHFWKDVSEDAKDLVRKLICVDPNQRITLEDALLHPWLADQNLRNLLADQVKVAGYEDLVDGILNPRNLLSASQQAPGTPRMLDRLEDSDDSNLILTGIEHGTTSRKRLADSIADIDPQPSKRTVL